ncbi:MAG: hypothetical protein H0T54_07215 [Geodermatophilaceae bacterium]|nr:hypothetical protein [Geodermatophilaceae bacterium]
MRPQVELHLARGEAELATARIQRFFRENSETELTAPLLLLLVQARLQRGAGEEAERAAAQLRALAASRSSTSTSYAPI